MKTRVSGLIILALALAWPVFAAVDAGQPDLASAKKAFNDGLYDLSLERAQSFLDANPGTSYAYDLHLLMGRSLYNLNNPSRALYEFGIILQAPGGSALEDEALYWTAEIYYDEGDHKKALEYYQKLLDKFPASRYVNYAMYSKAWSYYELGFPEDAAEAFRAVVRKYPYDLASADAQFRAAECEFLAGRYDRSGDELKSFLEKFPLSDKTADSYYLNGEVLYRLGRFSGAIDFFKRALAIAPQARWAGLAIYSTARAYFMLGDNARGLEAFKRCLNSDGALTRKLSLVGIAEVYARLGQRAEALKTCGELESLYPGQDASLRAACLKAKILYEDAAYDEAEAALKEALAVSGGSVYAPELSYALGCVYMRKGSLDEAIARFKAAGDGSRDPDMASAVLLRLGDIRVLKKEYKQATEYYDALLGKYPRSKASGIAQYELGNIFLRGGKPAQASMAYRSVIANFQDSMLKDKASYQLAAASFLNNDFSAAAHEYGRIASGGSGPVGVTAEFYYANSLYNLSRYPEALAIFERLAGSSPDTDLRALSAYQAGWCHYRMRNDADAIKAFGLIIGKYPDSGLACDAKYWLGDYYLSKRDFVKAREYFTAVAAAHAAGDIASEAMFRIGQALQEEGSPDEAVRQYKKVAEAFPDSASGRRAYRKAAKIEKERGAFDAAIEYYRKALTSADDELNAQVQYEIAEAYEAKGALRKATEEYLRAYELYPSGRFWATRALLKAGQLFEKSGNTSEAKTVYTKLAVLDVEESNFAKVRLKAMGR